MDWTPEAIEQVKALAAKGWSAGQVAIHLGNVSRNAVVGIGHRHKFQFHSQNRAPAPQPREPRPRRHIAFREPTVEAELPPAPTVGKFTLMELEYGMCKFILGDPRDPDHRYCGDPQKEGRPYCSPHARLCFETPEQRHAQRG